MWKRLGAVAIVAIAVFVQYERSVFLSKYWVWDDGLEAGRTAINTSDIYFPPDFVWGTATAAHQVEGDNDNNNWSLFENTPGKILRGQKAGKACEHWTRYREDIQLMKELGVNSYRFSIEWSKIEPQAGNFDPDVIQHYHDVIDALLAENITPWVTLHHFTHPIWFVEKGEFEKEENIAYFIRFSVRAFEEYGAKVKHWCTFNEPAVFNSFGWFLGLFPPSKQDWPLGAIVLRNLCEAHVQVYQALKALPHGKEAMIGIVNNIPQFEPSMWWNPVEIFVANIIDHVFNDCILNFFKTGKFEFRILHIVLTHENKNATTSNDFVGLNYYSHYHLRFTWDPKEFFHFVHTPNSLMTDHSYPIYAEGIYFALKRISQLNVPIYITENGLADRHDDRRHLFLRRYLYAVSKAIKDGVDVRGYFFWSLMDNFEWSLGYDLRFGLYEVDFETQKRTLRDGSKYFQKVIKTFSNKTTEL